MKKHPSSNQVLFVVGLPFFCGGWWLMLALKLTLLSFDPLLTAKANMVTVHPAQPHHFRRILKITLGGTSHIRKKLRYLRQSKSSVSCDSIIQVSPKFPPIPSPKDLGAAFPTFASDPGTGIMSGNFCGLQQTCGQFSNSTRGGSV